LRAGLRDLFAVVVGYHHQRERGVLGRCVGGGGDTNAGFLRREGRREASNTYRRGSGMAQRRTSYQEEGQGRGGCPEKRVFPRGGEKSGALGIREKRDEKITPPDAVIEEKQSWLGLTREAKIGYQPEKNFCLHRGSFVLERKGVEKKKKKKGGWKKGSTLGAA